MNSREKFRKYLGRASLWSQRTTVNFRTHKVSEALLSMGRLAISGWQKELANAPKVFFYAIVFAAGYDWYDTHIKQKSRKNEEEPAGSSRHTIRASGPGR